MGPDGLPDMSRKRNREYDICLSFAAEDRRYVSAVASHLRANGIRTFYDKYEQVALWGKDLYQHLDDVYRNAANYCVLFISKFYAKRLWTNHERRSAQARAFSEHYEYILPVRFDKTPLPGLLPTVGYIELKQLSPKQLSQLITKKIGIASRPYYLPPVPDRLFARLKLNTALAQHHAFQQAEEFVDALRRMSDLEKKLVAYIFIHGCPADLPANIHISADLLRRIAGLPPASCVRELERLSSLGFTTKVSTRKHNSGDPTIKLSFHVGRVSYNGPDDATGTIDEMVHCLSEEYCTECTLKAILSGDFSVLGQATRKPEKHSGAPKLGGRTLDH